MTDDERRAKHTAYMREWREKHRESVNASSRKHYENNRDEINARRRSRFVLTEDRARDSNRRKREDQAVTLPSAARRGEVWTSKEDLVVMDRTLTIKQIAFKLGRTACAVSVRRSVLVAGERERAASVAAAHGTIRP